MRGSKIEINTGLITGMRVHEHHSIQKKLSDLHVGSCAPPTQAREIPG